MPTQTKIDKLFLSGKKFCHYIPADGFIEGRGFRVSIVFEGEPDHFPSGDWPYDGGPSQKLPWFWGMTYEGAVAVADEQNERMGISKEHAVRIVASSMAASRRGRKSKL